MRKNLAVVLIVAATAFLIGRLTAPQPPQDMIEVYLKPEGLNLMVEARVWDGDGHVVRTFAFDLDEPLASLWR
jgi:hypothetical protein